MQQQTEAELESRPRTAAPPPAVTPTATSLGRGGGHHVEWSDEDDDDSGMFQFLPPDISSTSRPTPIIDPHGTVQDKPTNSTPPSPILTPPGTRHFFHTPPASPHATDPPSTSPAAAYAKHIAGTRSRRRSGWHEPQSPTTGEQGFDLHQRKSQDIGTADDAQSDGSKSIEWGGVSTGGEGISMYDMSSRSGARQSREERRRRNATASTVPTLPRTYRSGELDEEDSPYPEVRASVSNLDDPEMPVMTFRSWVLGITLATFFGGLNFAFNFRNPGLYIFPIVVLILSYPHPLGKLLAMLLPTTMWSVPQFLVRREFDDYCSLNPGPFNIKEHAVILLMANTAMSTAASLNYSVSLRLTFGINLGAGFDLLLALSTSMIGLSFAGMGRRFFIWPANIIWPQVLVFCTLLNTLHAEEFAEDDQEDGQQSGISRFKFFMYLMAASFAWYFLPGFLFQALSAFSFVCWAAPQNLVVNQLFGVYSGLGLSGITFDWIQIAYIGSPLVIPFWATVNIFVGFVLIYWIIGPILYYTNVWNFAYLPLMTSEVYDRFGSPYDTSAVISSDYKLDVEAYEAYSPPYLPLAFAMVYGICLAVGVACIVHTALYHGRSMWLQIKHKILPEDEDIHAKLMRNYPETPDWWYIVLFVVLLGVSIATVGAYDSGLPVWALLIALLISVVFYIPGAFIYAATSQQARFSNLSHTVVDSYPPSRESMQITTNLIVQLVGGYLMPNNIRGNMVFKLFGVNSGVMAWGFAQDLKIGHYLKIPPRTTFMVQIVAMFTSVLFQFGVTELLLENVSDFCSPTQSALLTCPFVTAFNSSGVIWGLVGPARQFSIGKMYSGMLWWMVAGLILPIVFWRLERHFPKVSWLKLVHIPVLLTGVAYAPPATGINYSSWFAFAFVFQYWMRRRYFRAWSKYNFILSAALDAGTAMSGLLIFFALQLPKGGSIGVDWWGNRVFTETADYAYLPWLTPPEEGFGPTSW